MQSGLRQPAAGAGPVGIGRRYGSVGVLLLGLALSACVGSGQIANLTETRRVTIAFESIEGPPPAVLHKLMKNLKEEAAARQFAVLPAGEANYRLRGYLAAHGGDSATSISWALDVYNTDQHRAYRLNGEERAASRMWAGADDQTLQRIARAGLTQFAAFVNTAPAPVATPVAAAPAPPQRASSTLGWLDDWTPEASGIFRIFRGEPSRPPEMAADAGSPVPPAEVPVPRGRPSPAGPPSSSALAFAAEN